MSTSSRLFRSSVFLIATLLTTALPAEDRLSILFLGDQGHHQPSQLAESITPALAQHGIDITYTEDLQQLSLENLQGYDGLLLYANIDELPPAQEEALLRYVAEGGGFIPLHCASYCFRNSAAFVDLVGAQFQKHGGQVFATSIVAPEHPIMLDFDGFSSWDETYVHTRHNDRNRIVLEMRSSGEQAEGQTQEPWTWVRTHGAGRVFYTAWGHDQRTWSHPGFVNLLERGIRWACQSDPSVVPPYRESQLFVVSAMTPPRTDVAPFETIDVGPKIPNYLAGEKWGTQGEIKTLMQLPLTPDESLKHYVTPEGFHLELFAAEPDFEGKPIAMNWDERGRLWVCETYDYPNELQPPGQGRDRIRICEDSDGDGRADKFTIFAEQLSIPTAIEFSRGGVLVQDGTVTRFLRDNDGDDRADQNDVLIEGWALGDTHGGVSNFQYGLDNHYWAMQGYNDSHPKYAGGQHPGFRQGPFRFSTRPPESLIAPPIKSKTLDPSPSPATPPHKLSTSTSTSPTVTSLEFIRSTTNNSWGLGSSEEGLIFASTANRAPSFFVPIPNRYYERVRGWTPSLVADAIAPDHLFHPITDKVRQVDHHGGYTAGAGHALYTARTYPHSWWNRVAFVCGPTGHLVGSYVLHRHGASYRDANEFNLVASDDEWAAPIMAEVGPDGHMWILDWYNYIVQNNPTQQGFETGRGNAYESDLRDKKHGRVYRLVYDGTEGEAGADRAPQLDANNPSTLVAALGHSNRLWRRHAQRLLVERGHSDVVPALIELLTNREVDHTGNNAAVTHALWVLHALPADDTNASSPNALSQLPDEMWIDLLQHPAAGVRRNALLTFPPRPTAFSLMTQAQSWRDPDCQVQLAALMALADYPTVSQTAGAMLVDLLSQPPLLLDRYRKDGIICAAATHAHEFLITALTDPKLKQQLSNEQGEVLRVVAEHAARNGFDAAQWELLLNNMSPSSIETIVPMAEGLAAGWQRDAAGTMPAAGEDVLNQLCQAAQPEQLAALLRLGTAWGSTAVDSYAHQLTESLIDKLVDNAAQDVERVMAVQEIISLVGSEPSAISDLLEQLSPQMPSAVGSGLIRALSLASAENVGDELLTRWPTLTPILRGDALAVLLSRPQWTHSLLQAIQAGTVALNELSLDQRRSLESHPDKELRELASKLASQAGISVDADRQRVVESYGAAVTATGSVASGKLLFTKNCSNCHKHSGEGQEVGPDLTGMAVHPKEELLIHILDPNRSVEGNFRRYTLLTADGVVLTGMLAGESQSAVELIDAEGKRLSVSREDIEQLTSTQLSLMPAGFEQQIPVAEMTDLLEFLTNKGRFVPLPLASVATAVSTKGLFSDNDNGPDRMVFEDWGPKEFAGVPFQLVDPQGTRRANIVLLNGPNGTLPPKMPKQVTLPCNMSVKSFHLLSGVSGWGFPFSDELTTSLIVRVHYTDGQSEDHPLKNGVHFADYIRRVDVPESQFAFNLRGQQLRYLAVQPLRAEPISSIDLLKGDDASAPIIMAITAER